MMHEKEKKEEKGKHEMPGGYMMSDKEMEKRMEIKKRMTSDGYMMDKKSVLPTGKGAEKYQGAKFIKKPMRGDFPKTNKV